ncbi:1-(5-phosphoribosyl)-5-[(5-phosphoribosylamino)methylideneamino] imidazole-4-carboxamide isomerase [Geosporobacter subterraneus DSM 17957]|uniref:1-(5-phosphoribosyl)-5-[(5-phosphoribosylamino)methylideneamino] imidazole-4-carboxamide isomerase n=1 Tax=Geosporobacter subterraneus DSM 17957 TaxID=1121919 RepID=A0A1M6JYA3_9FIRM|nr:1-(5-phosphoribosyl)-5-[(5-phosphoribosylamino)methylideneamino]imidazole-4-carboxamide isomerase [Geosporobacter subterraneus]SHJ51666.1 1-(5-phosphoribosyl)-5-[(5-phosphoribosylamino)methylideneamino] imidazole-4-carboxamide isomerase [Geosporobacter subterraneus DSM 17957]
MIIFPAIDIRKGKCVRLQQGEFSREQIFGENPVETALQWLNRGAQFLHVVDLDGALEGRTVHTRLIREIINRVPIPVQVGGGIRTLEDIHRLLGIGTARIILGTSAVLKTDLVKQAIALYGEKIAVSLDAKNGYIAVDGWKTVTNLRAIDFAKELQNIGLQTIVYTDIAKDGMLAGPNYTELEEMKKNLTLDLIASGGVSSKADIEKLQQMGFYGAIIGKALYTGDIRLEEL